MKNDKKTKKKSGNLSESPPNSSRAGNNQAHLKKESYPRLFLQSIVDSIPLPIVVIGTDMRIKFINHAAKLIASKKTKTSSHVGEHCYRFMFGYDTSCVSRGKSCPLIDSQETGETVRTERRLDIFHDFPRSYEIIASSLYGEDGTQFGIIEIFNDITDRKVIEKKLQGSREGAENLVKKRTASLLKSNKSLRQEVRERQQAEIALIRAKERSELLYHVIPSAIFTVNINRRITSWNDKAEAVTGYSGEEIVGKSCDIFALYPCTDKCGAFSDSIDKPIVGQECKIKTKNGQVRITTKNVDLLHDDNNNIIGAVESFEDITNLKEIEKQLRTERDKLKGMMSAIGQGMHILNHNYDIEYQNDIARQTFGDHKGKKCYRVYKGQDDPCDVCAMHTAIATNSIQRSELLMANGKYYEQSYAPFKDVDGQTKMLILLRDITEQKALQAETMRAAQLASVGELAAGVAHEINNPINGIINYAQIIQDESGGNQFVEEISGNIISEGERVANIVKNLLSFARQSDEGFDKVFVDDVVRDAVGLINHQLTKNCIILEMALPSDLPPVFAHHQQLQQVFLNLFSNACFALNQRYAGKDPNKKIIITGEVTIIEGKEYVRINFKDLGIGIPEEVINKIFEPFFSSKKPGEGTGLGLSISHGIIKKNNGFLHVETEFGRYTNMIVDLPAYREEDEQSLPIQEDFAVKGR